MTGNRPLRRARPTAREVYRRYARRSSRYYFYRGSLYGAREALEIWAEEHGGSGAALA